MARATSRESSPFLRPVFFRDHRPQRFLHSHHLKSVQSLIFFSLSPEPVKTTSQSNASLSEGLSAAGGEITDMKLLPGSCYEANGCGSREPNGGVCRLPQFPPARAPQLLGSPFSAPAFRLLPNSYLDPTLPSRYLRFPPPRLPSGSGPLVARRASDDFSKKVGSEKL